MYSENESKQVVLTLARGDYELLMLALGFVSGSVSDDKPRLYGLLDLVNRINEGNPNFRPYETDVK